MCPSHWNLSLGHKTPGPAPDQTRTNLRADLSGGPVPACLWARGTTCGHFTFLIYKMRTSTAPHRGTSEAQQLHIYKAPKGGQDVPPSFLCLMWDGPACGAQLKGSPHPLYTTQTVLPWQSAGCKVLQGLQMAVSRRKSHSTMTLRRATQRSQWNQPRVGLLGPLQAGKEAHHQAMGWGWREDGTQAREGTWNRPYTVSGKPQ